MGWRSECSWWSKLWAESCSWSWCDSSSWSACRTSSSFSLMSFSVSVSVSATPGTTGMGKSVPLSRVSLLQRDTRFGKVHRVYYKVRTQTNVNKPVMSNQLPTNIVKTLHQTRQSKPIKYLKNIWRSHVFLITVSFSKQQYSNIVRIHIFILIFLVPYFFHLTKTYFSRPSAWAYLRLRSLTTMRVMLWMHWAL